MRAKSHAAFDFSGASFIRFSASWILSVVALSTLETLIARHAKNAEARIPIRIRTP
jgi:hypothetical protein